MPRQFTSSTHMPFQADTTRQRLTVPIKRDILYLVVVDDIRLSSRILVCIKLLLTGRARTRIITALIISNCPSRCRLRLIKNPALFNSDCVDHVITTAPVSLSDAQDGSVKVLQATHRQHGNPGCRHPSIKP